MVCALLMCDLTCSSSAMLAPCKSTRISLLASASSCSRCWTTLRLPLHQAYGCHISALPSFLIILHSMASRISKFKLTHLSSLHRSPADIDPNWYTSFPFHSSSSLLLSRPLFLLLSLPLTGSLYLFLLHSHRTSGPLL